MIGAEQSLCTPPTMKGECERQLHADAKFISNDFIKFGGLTKTSHDACDTNENQHV